MQGLIPEPDFPELQRDPDSHIWYVRKFVKGKGRLFRSTRESRSKANAKKIALTLLSEFIGSPYGGKVYSFAELGELVIERKKARRKKTQESATLHIHKHLNPFFGNFPADQITEDTWAEYVAKCQIAPPERRLFNDWKHFVMIMRLAYYKGLIPRPLQTKNPDPKTDAGKLYSSDEMSRLLACASPHLDLQIKMGRGMGMRKKEILGLSWDRIDEEKRTITLGAKDTKTKRKRVFSIRNEVWDILVKRKQYLLKRDGQVLWVFPSRYEKLKPQRDNKTAWQACKRRAKVKGRFHDLRHTFLNEALLVHKANPLDVSFYAGVSLKVIQEVYLKPNSENTAYLADLLPVIKSVVEIGGDSKVA